MESPSGYKERDYRVRSGSHGFVCMGNGMYVGKERVWVAEGVCVTLVAGMLVNDVK